jgi:tRNA pseudouridine55 synthase
MDGLLLVNKPQGWTSFDVVAKVRGIIKSTGLKKPKVGHTGTLDPLATGLLVLTVGTYCKRAQEFSKLDKVYEVELELGTTSTTDDEEGQKTKTNQPIPDEKVIKKAILSFVGEIQQTPPAYSAIKVDGKRAYKLAREGKEVTLEPRKVTIYSIEDIKITGNKVSFNTKVSSGTYIRSLARDIGEKLACGAYMTGLRRTEVGEFVLEKATLVENLTPDNVDNHLLTI